MSDFPSELTNPAQANGPVVVDRNFKSLKGAGVFGHDEWTTSGLTHGYYGGTFDANAVTGGTVLLTDNTTNYVVAHRTTRAVTTATNTTNWNNTATYGRVGRGIASGGAVTWHDERFGPGGILGGGAGLTSVDADDVTYTPTTLADWDGSADPGDVEQALDQLAERVTDVEGAGSGSSQGRHAVYIAAGSMRPSVAGGCAVLAAIASAANQPDIVSLDFDTTTQEYAQFSITMPKSWDEGTVTFAPLWSHAATTTNFGVVFDLQGYAASNDDAIATAFGTAQTSTDTGGTTNDIYMGPESSAITIAGTPAAEDTVFFRLSRVTGNGSDTMAIDARLHGIVLYITTNADTDA
jgi:hypothetical protein